jgi:hypothetical protein
MPNKSDIIKEEEDEYSDRSGLNINSAKNISLNLQ